jgi:hypothetical protein
MGEPRADGTPRGEPTERTSERQPPPQKDEGSAPKPTAMQTVSKITSETIDRTRPTRAKFRPASFFERASPDTTMALGHATSQPVTMVSASGPQ